MPINELENAINNFRTLASKPPNKIFLCGECYEKIKKQIPVAELGTSSIFSGIRVEKAGLDQLCFCCGFIANLLKEKASGK